MNKLWAVPAAVLALTAGGLVSRGAASAVVTGEPSHFATASPLARA